MFVFTIAIENEIQQFKCRANNGTFDLSFRGNYTLPIAYNASAKDVQVALEQLPSIISVSVSIQGGDEIGPNVNLTVCTETGNNSKPPLYVLPFRLLNACLLCV